jgi:hypothetical protein
VVPAECLQLVLAHCVRILHTVINPTESEDALPVYVDTVADWKDFCSAAKGTIKFVLSSMALAAPEVALRGILQIAQEGGTKVQGLQAGASAEGVALAANWLEVRVVCWCFRVRTWSQALNTSSLPCWRISENVVLQL